MDQNCCRRGATWDRFSPKCRVKFRLLKIPFVHVVGRAQLAVADNSPASRQERALPTQRPGPGGEGGSDARRRPRSAGGPPPNSLPPRRRTRSLLPRRPAGARGSAATVEDREPPPLRAPRRRGPRQAPPPSPYLSPCV